MQPGPQGQPKLVLVVEDDPDLREMFSAAIRQAGLRVESARDGISAIGQIPYLKPDCIVLDLMLPTVSGLEILDMLQSASGAKTPVVVITGVYTRAGMKEKIQAFPNVVGFFEKPVDSGSLREAVIGALNRPV